MTKLPLVLSLVCFSIGAIIFYYVGKYGVENKNYSELGPVVWTTTEIKKGSEITENMVIAKAMLNSAIPTYALAPERVIGAHADHDLIAGHIINKTDIRPSERLVEVSVYALKDIPAGVCIHYGEVRSVPESGMCNGVDTHDHCTAVLGRWTRTNLLKGQRVLDRDLFPE